MQDLTFIECQLEMEAKLVFWILLFYLVFGTMPELYDTKNLAGIDPNRLLFDSERSSVDIIAILALTFFPLALNSYLFLCGHQYRSWRP